MADRSRGSEKTLKVIKDYTLMLIWAVLLAGIIRGGIVEACHVPSGSMEPAMQIGDHFLVNKTAYGLKLPYTNLELLPMGLPERGDIAVFRYPEDKSQTFVKRIMALPGETVLVRGKDIYINHKKIKDPWGFFTGRALMRKDFGPFKVPDGHFFMMGDNRDNSYDSRFWAQGKGMCVPLCDIKGKAFFRYFAFKGDSYAIRWERMPGIVK
ncbi:signal peptidase I [Dethiosulfatarculus sandiegensis]|uniref:signal peptidase I n=1 Tax=Dethiosulfatarculus sandiegensis TaxID=1429043 RepID=UPI0005CA7AA7|nr:signal peptidase I [Dethiosulfatarculus sandiegensis]